MTLKIGCFSDTHTYHRYVKIDKEDNIDILICAGDFTHKGRKDEIEEFMFWFKQQPAKYRVLVAGNHEITFDKTKLLYGDAWLKEIIADFESFHNNYYVYNTNIDIEGCSIYGSPVTPWFGGHIWAFNEHRGEPIKEIWDKIEERTDIIITHGPPYGILDYVKYGKKNVGCEELLKKVFEIKPKLHIFGHIHIDGHEYYDSNIYVENDITFINASICDNQYYPINKLTIVEI